MKRWVLFIIVLISHSFAMALPDVNLVTESGKKDRYLVSGEFRGGEAGRTFLLNEMKRYFSAETKIERYIFNFTNGAGEALQTRPGFYSIKMEPENYRVILEFAQIVGSRADFKQLNALI